MSNTLIIYPMEGTTYPFEWVEPDDDDPFTYPAMDEPPLQDPDFRDRQEEYDHWLDSQSQDSISMPF